MSGREYVEAVKAKCDAEGTPYPWLREHKFVAGGSMIHDLKNPEPLRTFQCSKCGYRLVHQSDEGGLCPDDGLELIAL